MEAVTAQDAPGLLADPGGLLPQGLAADLRREGRRRCRRQQADRETSMSSHALATLPDPAFSAPMTGYALTGPPGRRNPLPASRCPAPRGPLTAPRAGHLRQLPGRRPVTAPARIDARPPGPRPNHGPGQAELAGHAARRLARLAHQLHRFGPEPGRERPSRARLLPLHRLHSGHPFRGSPPTWRMSVKPGQAHRLPRTRPKSRGEGASPASPAKRSGVPKAAMSPLLAATSPIRPSSSGSSLATRRDSSLLPPPSMTTQ
jgi:hypothetical protein